MRISDSAKFHRIILLCCIVLQASVALVFSLTLRHEFKTSGFDGITFAQLMDNFLHGHGLVTSIDPPYVPQHWLGVHFSPLLYLLAPIYYLFPHVETFLVMGTAAIALAAWPLYLTAKTILENSFQALVIALLYLINPYVLNAAIWDFHEVDFAPLCIAIMLWAVIHQKRITLLFMSILLLSIKEHYGLAVAGFGLLWAWRWHDLKFGLGLAAAGVAILCFILFMVMPHVNPLGQAMMINATSGYGRFHWLTDITEIKSHAVPILAGGIFYLISLLLTLYFIPLGAAMWLLPGMADAGINIASNAEMMRFISSYHSLPLIPVVLVAFCVSIKKYCGKSKRKITAGDTLLAVSILSLFFSYTQLALPLPGMRNIWEFSSPRLTYTPADAKALESINGMIPADVQVSAQMNVIPHLSLRYEMYPFPQKFADSQYIVLQLRFPYRRATSIFGTPYAIDGNEYFLAVEQLLTDPAWGITLAENRWVVLEKHGADAPNARQTAMEWLAKTKAEYQAVSDKIRQ